MSDLTWNDLNENQKQILLTGRCRSDHASDVFTLYIQGLLNYPTVVSTTYFANATPAGRALGASADAPAGVNRNSSEKSITYEAAMAELQARAEKAEAECAALRQALEWYADSDNHMSMPEIICSKVDVDFGELAEKALASTTAGADILARLQAADEMAKALENCVDHIDDQRIAGYELTEETTEVIREARAALKIWENQS